MGDANIDIQYSHLDYISLDNHSEINGYLEIHNNSYFNNITLNSSFIVDMIIIFILITQLLVLLI
jgi:hypothetical protein